MVCLASLTGCLVGPDYQRPPPATPPTPEFKETMGFRPANPSDAVDRGPWWQIYGDPALNGLAAQVDISNQTLKAAEAAYRQARALVRRDQSGLYPSITASASAQQTGSGNNRGSGTTIIAAAQEGRVAYGCEISPHYCDVIRRRWTTWAKEHGQDPGPGSLDG